MKSQEASLVDRPDKPLTHVIGVGRVGNDDFERTTESRPVEDIFGLSHDDAGLPIHAEVFRRAPQPRRDSGIDFDEHDPPGSAAERFESQGSAAGEEIEDFIPRQILSEYVEQRLADTVAGRTKVRFGRNG